MPVSSDIRLACIVYHPSVPLHTLTLLSSMQVTVPGAHVASVLVAGKHRSLQLTAMNNSPQPDAAVLARSKIRWLRSVPSAARKDHTADFKANSPFVCDCSLLKARTFIVPSFSCDVEVTGSSTRLFYPTHLYDAAGALARFTFILTLWPRRYYPACSTALFTGLYATIAGLALMWKPKALFGRSHTIPSSSW